MIKLIELTKQRKIRFKRILKRSKNGQPDANDICDNESVFKGYKYFMAVYESTIVSIIEKGNHKD